LAERRCHRLGRLSRQMQPKSLDNVVNQAGGLPMGRKKCKVVVLSYDSKCSPQGAASAANSLVSRDVSVIVGPLGSPEVTGIKPVTERNKQVKRDIAYAKDAIGTRWPLAFHALPGPSAWARPLV
jgi:branched-chain amino acid transport system substrate-binding protein